MAMVWPTKQQDSQLPNIVFVMADDLGYGDLHYNGGRADTPNLDAMANGPNSIQLNRHYSGSPECAPTRGTVMTGRNHNRYCIWRANVPRSDTCTDSFAIPLGMPLPPTEITVAEILKQHGYRTAAFGKWGLGALNPCPLENSHPLWPVSHPGIHGFDTWWATGVGLTPAIPNFTCYDKCRCQSYHSIPNKSGSLKSWLFDGEDSHFILERFVEFVDDIKDKGQPFFAYLPLHAVHLGYTVTDSYIEMYASQGYSEVESNYYGSITAIDDVMGLIREFLNNVSNNTLLWFTSDNGAETFINPGSTGGLRGGKHKLTEGGIRVPGIIEWPAVIDRNVETEFPVVTSDLLPTVCDILGVDPPSDRPIDGTSILPLLRGENVTRDKSIGWMYRVDDYGDFDKKHKAVLMSNQYKLITTYKNGVVKKAALYDLAEDPVESRDVKDEHPDLYGSMKEELDQWRQSVIHSANEEVNCVGYSFYDRDRPCLLYDNDACEINSTL